jgi:putative RecB family exonuclease
MRADMYLSYSQISTYMACPLKYKFHYMDAVEPEFTPVSLAFGAAIHEAVAAYYQNRLEGDELMPSQMMDVYRNDWRKQENIRFFNGDNESSLQAKAGLLFKVFHSSVDPTSTILGVEERFDMPMDNMPSFLGFIDLIEQDSAGNITIVDLKTASKKPTDTNVHQNLQLTAYSLGARALGFNGPETKCRLDVLTKTKVPELLTYETVRTEADRKRFVSLVKGVWRGIEQGVWFPKHDWHCLQCAYQTHCDKW